MDPLLQTATQGRSPEAPPPTWRDRQDMEWPEQQYYHDSLAEEQLLAITDHPQRQYRRDSPQSEFPGFPPSQIQQRQSSVSSVILLPVERSEDYQWHRDSPEIREYQPPQLIKPQW